MIIFFVDNDFENADSFIDFACEKLHTKEYGFSTGIDEYEVVRAPKKFYDASCWEKFIFVKNDISKYLNIESELLLNEIADINQKYATNQVEIDKQINV